MRRRLGIALIGMVVASLTLTGLGTIVLAAVGDRAATEDNLREQAEAFGSLLEELAFVPADAGAGNVRSRLERITRTISVEGIGVVVLPRAGAAPIGELPPGITIDDLDIEALRAGQTISGQKGNLIWAAAASTNRAGVPQLLVLTRDPDPILLPAFRWFVVAGLATIGLAVLITVRLSRRLTSPIQDASRAAARIAGGDLSARIPEQQAEIGGEVGELVNSINAMADNLDRSRALERQFLLSVSHDLRTPLTSIKGYGEALADGAVDDPVRVGAIIESESKRLERLVGDLLLLARLEGTGFEYSLAATDVAALVRATALGLRHEATARGVDLTVRVPEETSIATVDADRYAQVVSNLVGNALRFADRTAVVTVWEAEGRIHLSVADDGPGISDDDLPFVFERLYVAQNNPKVKESGSGLGLAIVRELVEGMGGAVMARRSSIGGAELVASFRPAPESARVRLSDGG